MKIVEIIECKQCRWVGTNMAANCWRCNNPKINARNIPIMAAIPDWCPLDDATG